MKADQKVEALARSLGYEFMGSTKYPWNDYRYTAVPKTSGEGLASFGYVDIMYDSSCAKSEDINDRLKKIVKMLGFLRKVKFTNKGDGTFMLVLNEGRWEEVYGILEELENQMKELEDSMDSETNKESN